MRFSFIPFFLLPLAYAQSSTSSPSSSASAASNNNGQNNSTSNSTLSVITTTITNLNPGPSSSSSVSTLLTLTLTLDAATTASINSTVTGNGTTISGNGTLSNNGTETNGTVQETWKAGDDWIPFHIRIDPAYGVLGGLLIISGIPVAGLGGKNRWSSLAIVSGYALMLFTLVMILQFGVQDNLQPPSPSPPSTTLRGLYLLACIIAACIGAGIGIFFFNISKYLVSAAGGFTFGWYLLELKTGGLITSVLGRWGLLGGLTVAALLASIVPKMSELMVLVSTAWIGATAFVLGVDCFTRAGLKEFYVYNLGFHSLFPKLEGAKYPLTQTMIIELGILAAVVVIGAAIQARVLNRIQKRLRVAREEEEMRIEADEVARAAERFKNVGSELQEWEEKHGKGKGVVVHDLEEAPVMGDGSSSQVPILSRDQGSSTHRSLSPGLPALNTGRGLYEDLPLNSPTLPRDTGSPSTIGFQGIEELKDDSTPKSAVGRSSPTMTDPELEDKIKLLEEVRKARESVRGSIDELRRQTPTPSIGSRLDHDAKSISRKSIGSRLLEDDPRARRISSSSSRMLDAPSMTGRQSISSRIIDLTHDSPYNQPMNDDLGPSRPRHLSTSPSQMLDTQSRSSRQVPSAHPSPTDWDRYVTERQIVAPPGPINPHARHSQYELTDRRDKTSSMFDLASPPMASRQTEERRSRTISMLHHDAPRAQPRLSYDSDQFRNPDHLQNRSDPYAPGEINGSASSRHNDHNPRRSLAARSMTYEELSEKHRKMISALQNPVSSMMKEEEELKAAKERWEKQKREEKREMERKEREKQARWGEGGDRSTERERAKVEEKQEILKVTDEWRRSVHMGLDEYGRSSILARDDRDLESGRGRNGGRRQSHGQGTSARGIDKRYSNIIN